MAEAVLTIKRELVITINDLSFTNLYICPRILFHGISESYELFSLKPSSVLMDCLLDILQSSLMIQKSHEPEIEIVLCH